MPTFTLKTAFTSDDLARFLASGSNIVVAKPNNGGAPNVAWIVFRPLLDNSMTWTEEYGIYASNTDIMSGGALLVQMSKTEYPAMEGAVYPLNAAGYFGPPSTVGGAQGSYYAQNEYNNLPKGYLTMGLYQNANVNGAQANGNAVSAAPVIFNSRAEMTPFTTVYLWVQSQVQSNSVVTVVTSPQTIVTFGGTVDTVSLRYDSTTGRFMSASQQPLPAGATLDYHEPALF